MSNMELKGKYGEAKVFTDNIDQITIDQVINFLDQSFVEGANTRIMPDCHAGKGAVIGTTMLVKNKVCPNLVGVDIGCGMLTVEITKENIDFEKLDKIIRMYVPSGQSVRKKPHRFMENVRLNELIAPYDENRGKLSIGSLGGGNHFIEINESEDGRLYIVIHSGSRHIGVKVASYHQNQAIVYHQQKDNKVERDALIDSLKSQGKYQDIQQALMSYNYKELSMPKELAYLEGEQMEKYLHDLRIAQEFAYWNRASMMDEILLNMGLKEVGRLDTVHNYIDLDHMILRKGAISAKEGEEVLIPINMRDGSLLAKGKGSIDWNYSAPHGAGRILSRSKAKSLLSVHDFKETMKEVFSTSVGEDTLDESPFAYKSMDEIISNTKDTIDVLSILKPLYNFKAK